MLFRGNSVRHLQRDRGDASVSCQAIALPEDDLSEPGRKRLWVLELRKALVALDESLLRGILRQLEIAKHGVCVAHSHILKLQDNRPQRIPIPPLCPGYLLDPIFHQLTPTS